MTTPQQGETWRIGAVTSHGGNVVLYFHPHLVSDEDLRDLRAALPRDVDSPYRMILTAVGGLSGDDAKTATFGDVIEIDGNTGTISAFGDPATIVGIPTKRVGGSPNLHGETLQPIIRSRFESGAGRTRQRSRCFA